MKIQGKTSQKMDIKINISFFQCLTPPVWFWKNMGFYPAKTTRATMNLSPITFVFLIITYQTLPETFHLLYLEVKILKLFSNFGVNQSKYQLFLYFLFMHKSLMYKKESGFLISQTLRQAAAFKHLPVDSLTSIYLNSLALIPLLRSTCFDSLT